MYAASPAICSIAPQYVGGPQQTHKCWQLTGKLASAVMLTPDRNTCLMAENLVVLSRRDVAVFQHSNHIQWRLHCSQRLVKVGVPG